MKNNKPDLYERLRLKGLEASRQAEIKKITTNHINSKGGIRKMD